MKNKIYLSITLFSMFILMFAIMLIPTQAYTFNGLYDFNNIDLNTSLTELNGASLNDLFDYEYLETLPLISYNGYRNKFELDGNQVVFNEYLYIDLGYKNLYDINQDIYANNNTTVNNITNNSFVVTANSTSSFSFVTFRMYVIPNKIYTFKSLSTTTSINGGGVQARDTNNNILAGSSGVLNPTFTLTSPSNGIIDFRFYATGSISSTGDSTFSNIQLEEGSNVTDYVPYGVLSEIIRIHITPILNTDLTQSLYFYNLENMNIDLINYYFAVFLLHKFNLPVDDLWNQAFNAGSSEGFSEGYSEGYTQGHFDYHTGTYLFDYTEGNSYIEGIETGYNNGVDYAVQNNISILSIFELIFGVALNIITFIITIDIFGISILSIISVLSLMVGAVWILKMVRG